MHGHKESSSKNKNKSHITLKYKTGWKHLFRWGDFIIEIVSNKAHLCVFAKIIQWKKLKIPESSCPYKDHHFIHHDLYTHTQKNTMQGENDIIEVLSVLLTLLTY